MKKATLSRKTQIWEPLGLKMSFWKLKHGETETTVIIPHQTWNQWASAWEARKATCGVNKLKILLKGVLFAYIVSHEKKTKR